MSDKITKDKLLELGFEEDRDCFVWPKSRGYFDTYISIHVNDPKCSEIIDYEDRIMLKNLTTMEQVKTIIEVVLLP